MTIRRASRLAAAALSCSHAIKLEAPAHSSPSSRRACKRAAATALFCFFHLSPSHAQDASNRPPRSAPLTSSPASASTASNLSANEQFLLEAANRERAAEGLQPLHWDSALAEAARQHAQVMLSQNLLLHQCLNEAPLDERAAQAGAKFAMIAENIAVGPNAAEIHDGWMHSTGHRKNILNPSVTAIGIAVVRGNAGMFAVQDFSRPVESLSFSQQEEKIVALLKGAGLQIAEATEDARRTCALQAGFEGTHMSYVIHFEVTDLDKLPIDLLKKAKSRDYKKAAVGACNATAEGHFTRYRLAVLLE